MGTAGRKLLLLLLLASAPRAEVFVWVDDRGLTHVTDDPAAIPEAARERAAGPGAERAELWAGRDILGGPLLPVPGATSRDSDRVVRLLRGAADDLARGELARASASLRSALRLEPARPEAHWYLSRLERQRGHFDTAESHLRSFLGNAGEAFAEWRPSAERRLREIEDERRLADVEGESRPLRLMGISTPHFRVQYDAALAAATPDYAGRVVGLLLDARTELGARLGVVPSEPLGVVLYGKAAYVRAHRHRFSFQTVGFFDGRIHVVSQAHPSGELRGLLFHEYTHALFNERTGGDRPFWLNEGLAVLAERSARGLNGLTRSERSSLRARDHEGRWISLHRLAPSFSGLDQEDVRAAYLEATAAAAWIEAHTRRAQRRNLLERLGRGASADEALRDAVGVDTAGLERALRAEIRAEFPTARW